MPFLRPSKPRLLLPRLAAASFGLPFAPIAGYPPLRVLLGRLAAMPGQLKAPA